MLILTIILPLISFILLSLSRGNLPENYSNFLGISSVGSAALVAIHVVFNFLKINQQSFTVHLWRWISIDNFSIDVNLMLDSLSLIMILVVTSIGFLVHIFSSWYMHGEENYSRFLAYMNLFISSMLVLVLADNLLLMYLGWEMVGLCSYLLINFYHIDPKNNIAAMKAFIITRIGDTFLALALFALFNELNTLNINEILKLASTHFTSNNKMIYWINLMLLFSAIAKSAQLPLHVWLADAMVAPTPASALIHAATMVTAGVYLIIRTHGLFLITPEILHIISILGAITVILAGCIALVQTNIKIILAYSTISQIGYMFLALGVQAWDAAIFHLITHACFKALLFLSSGSLILACNYEHNIFRMGGLYKSMPFIYFCFLIGGASLASLPFITSSFFSKREILTFTVVNGHIGLTVAGLIGTFITSIYIFRAIFSIFHGTKQTNITSLSSSSIAYYLPLTILMVLSIFINKNTISFLLPNKLDINNIKYSYSIMLELVASLLSLVGILVASFFWLNKHTACLVKFTDKKLGYMLNTWCYNALGFNWLYNTFFIKPFLIIARLLRYDPVNILISKILAMLTKFFIKNFTLSVTGYLRWYIASISIGTIIIMLLLLVFNIQK